jgi:hypothetical protein
MRHLAAPLLRSPEMSTRRAATQAYDDEARWRGSGPSPRRRSGPRIGPLRITPARVFLLVALLGGVGFLAYSIFIRDALQVPLMASGFAVVGIVLAVAAVMSIGAVISAGRESRDAAAFFTALLGGFLAVGALMCLAAAAIMSMIWSGTSAS